MKTIYKGEEEKMEGFRINFYSILNLNFTLSKCTHGARKLEEIYAIIGVFYIVIIKKIVYQ